MQNSWYWALKINDKVGKILMYNVGCLHVSSPGGQLLADAEKHRLHDSNNGECTNKTDAQRHPQPLCSGTRSFLGLGNLSA